MKINTEFNIREKVYYIYGTEIREGYIFTIITRQSIQQGSIYTNTLYKISKDLINQLYENKEFTSFDLFRTKEGAAERWLNDQGLEVGIK